MVVGGPGRDRGMDRNCPNAEKKVVGIWVPETQ